MEELKNELVSVSVDDSSLGVTKGYGYVTKDNKQRYTYNESYFVNGEKVFRKHSTENGEFYYNIELLDVVVESFVTKDGNKVTKVYPLSEVPYLAADANSVDPQVLTNYLQFKLHR